MKHLLQKNIKKNEILYFIFSMKIYLFFKKCLLLQEDIHYALIRDLKAQLHFSWPLS